MTEYLVDVTVPDTCAWEYDDLPMSAGFTTECSGDLRLVAGKYCPFCGKPISLGEFSELTGPTTPTITLPEPRLKQHQALLTKDGRKVGNAIIASAQGDVVEIVTDFGNTLRLSPADVHALFYAGEIQDVSERQESQRRLRAQLAPPAYVMPKPPGKTCFICHAKMDVPHAKFLHLVGFWHFEWDCAKRCDPGLGIVFFPPQHYAKGVTKEELEQAGFVIVEAAT